MFNIAGFHIPKQIAFKSGAAILEKLGWDHEGLKPLGAVEYSNHYKNINMQVVTLFSCR